MPIGFSVRATMCSRGPWFVACTAASIGIFLVYIYQGIGNPLANTIAKSSETNGIFKDDEIQMLENGFKDQTNPRLLKWLYTHWINLPSRKELKLSYSERKDHSQLKQTEVLHEVMGRKTNGFFIECGAKNGETLSNSLFFERFCNWTGLLVEPNPKEYKELLQKNRNSYSINACLNTKNITGKYEFIPEIDIGGLVNEMEKTHKKTLQNPNARMTVQCFTLWSIMKAIGKKHVDFFSLDVEGAEMGILKTIPFTELDIDVFLIEYLVRGSQAATSSKVEEMQRFLGGHGYKLIKKMALDLLFVKKGKQYK